MLFRQAVTQHAPPCIQDQRFFHTELSSDYREALCHIELRGENTEDCEYTVSLSREGRGVASFTESATDGDHTLSLKDAVLWSPEEPNLYELCVRLLKDGEIKDERIMRVGIREITCERHRFLVNGKPVFLCGVCKHELIGDLGHTVTHELIRRDLEMIKALGCNFVRLVHYPHRRETLDIADELGLMVSEEPGLWWSDTSDEKISSGSIEVLKRTVLRDRSHPSVAFWLCFNECVFTEEFLVRSADACKEIDPTRPVSGANCMSDEDTLVYYNKCGFDFYTMHPYAETFERAARSASLLSDKPLVFTEWGGYYVHDNPRLMREFIHKMRALYEKNSDEGALAGAFLWAFAEQMDFNRAKPAVTDGVLLEGLVDSERNPRRCFEVFREAFSEDMNAIAAFEYRELMSFPEGVRALDYLEGGSDANEMIRKMTGRKRPSFLEEQRPRVIRVGPVLKEKGTLPIETTPRLILGEDKLVYTGDALCERVHLIGAVSASIGYPISREYGELAATVRVIFEEGDALVYQMKNGIGITTVYATLRSSRIDPRGDDLSRFMEFSYDKSYEQYIINALTLELGGARRVRRVEIEGSGNGYAILNYGVIIE